MGDIYSDILKKLHTSFKRMSIYNSKNLNFSKAVTKKLKSVITAHDSLNSDKFLKAIHMGNSL